MIEPLPPQATTLEEVVVTAARLPPAAGEAAFSVIRLEDHQLKSTTRLDEAIAQVPAVSLFRRTSSLSANPTTQGISLRAIAPSGAGRTLVTLDGVPLNDPFGGWVLWSQLPNEALSSLDIVRGAGAGPYGAGALTGVIQLRERDLGGVLDLSVAERGGARAAAAASHVVGRVRLTGSGLYETSDGYVAVRGEGRGDADEPLSLEAKSASLRLDAPVGEAGLSVRASAYEETRGSGLAGTASRSEGQLLSATLARPSKSDALGWRLQAWHRRSDFSNSSAAVGAGRNTTTPANDQYKTPATGWGLNGALRRQFDLTSGGQVEWELGADARFNEGATHERFRYMAGQFTRDRIAGGEASVVGLYGEGSWTYQDWLVAGGVRLDTWRNQGGHRLERDRQTGALTLDEREAERHGEVLSARLGVRRKLGEDWAVRGAAYSGFRPASLNELHRPFRVGNDLTEANAGLIPETLKGVEIGLGREASGLAFGVTLFWNQIEEAIVNVTLAEGPGTFPRAGFVPAGGVLRQRQNAGVIEAVGLELYGRRALGDRFELTGAVALTDAHMDGGQAAAQLTGLRPAQAPKWSATAGLDWQASPQLALGLQARYESKRFDDDLNSRILAEALRLDARADWQVSQRTLVWVALDNLMDESIDVAKTGDGVVSYAPPRSFRLGLSVSY